VAEEIVDYYDPLTKSTHIIGTSKEAKKVIDGLSTVKGFENMRTKRHNKAVLAIDENDVVTKKSFSNFSNIKTDEVRNLNPVSLLKYKYVIIENPKKSLEVLANKVNK